MTVTNQCQQTQQSDIFHLRGVFAGGDWVNVKIDTNALLKVKTIGQLSYLKVLSLRLGIGTGYARCALSHAC